MEEKQITFFSENKEENKVVKIGVDKFLLAVIFLLITLTLVFFAGVKVGKKASFKNKAYPVAVLKKGKEESQKRASLEAKTETKKKKELSVKLEKPELLPAAKEKKSFFTVQLATYSEKNSYLADRNIKLLKQKKVEAFKIKRKNYIVLCAGKFEKKAEAAKQKENLEKDYPGCFIKEVKK